MIVTLPRTRAALAALAFMLCVASTVSADPVCTARAPLAGQDDWCERWVSTPPFHPLAMTMSPDAATTHALVLFPTGEIGIAVLENATGAVVRSFRIVPEVPGARTFSPRQMEPGPAHDVLYVTGMVGGRVETDDGFVNYTHTLTVAYSTHGESLWQTVHEPFAVPAAVDYPTAMALSRDGGTIYLTAGRSVDEQGFLSTVAMDASDGTVRWIGRFTDDELWGVGHSVAVSPANDAVYVSTLRGPGLVEILAYRTDAVLPTGVDRLTWRRQETTTAFTYARGGMRVSDDGVIVLSGYDLSGEYPHIAVLGLDATGKRKWAVSAPQLTTVIRIFVEEDPSQSYIGTAEVPTAGIPMKMTMAGNHVYVAGYQAEGDAQYQVLTATPAISGVVAAFDVGTGELVWQRTYRMQPERMFFPIGLFAEAGRVFLSGIASDCNFLFKPSYKCTTELHYSTVTVVFDQETGDIARVARYNHTGVPGGVEPSPLVGISYDFQLASAAGADGSFITGASSSHAQCFECSRREQSVIFAYQP